MEKKDLADFAEKTYTVSARLVALVPEDMLDWRPLETGNWWIMGQLLYHLPEATGGLMNGLVKGQWDEERDGVPSVSSVAEALERLQASRVLTAELLADLSEEDYRKRKICGPRPCEPDYPEPLRKCLHHCVLHQVYHHATLFTYLKLLGVEVGTQVLYGDG